MSSFPETLIDPMILFFKIIALVPDLRKNLALKILLQRVKPGKNCLIKILTSRFDITVFLY